MRKKIQLLTFALMIFSSSTALAIDAGTRSIQQIGCNTHSSLCFVVVSGEAVGPAECLSNTFVWDSKLANGRETLSLLTAAMHNGKSVKFELDAACSLLQNDAPGLMSANVQK